MSIFTDTQKPVEPVTTDTQNTDTTDVLEELVGEGKKFKTVQDLAKGKLEADKFIEDLKAKLAKAEAEVSKQDYSSELLAALKDKAAQVATPSGNNDQDQDKPTLGLEQLESLVEKKLSQVRASEEVQRNRQVVDKALQDAYGTEALAKVKEKASSLGVTPDYLLNLAEKAPRLFLKTMDVTPKPGSSFKESSKATDSFYNPSGERNSKYYSTLRKENRNQYYSAKVQEQMLQDRIRLGDKFFN